MEDNIQEHFPIHHTSVVKKITYIDLLSDSLIFWLFLIMQWLNFFNYFVKDTYN